jgi:hypothetical protein
MTTAEALELISGTIPVSVCNCIGGVDGTVLTSDCPVGLRWRLWKKLRKRMAWAASLFAMLFLPGCPVGGNLRRPELDEKALSKGNRRTRLRLAIRFRLLPQHLPRHPVDDIAHAKLARWRRFNRDGLFFTEKLIDVERKGILLEGF